MSSGRDRMPRRDAKAGEAKKAWGHNSVAAAARAARQAKPLPPPMKRKCKLCGCPLGFGRTHSGKLIPLDLRAPVYAIVFEESDGHGTEVVKTELAYVDHSASCPSADAPARKRKRAADANPGTPERAPGDVPVEAGGAEAGDVLEAGGEAADVSWNETD